MFPRRSLPGLLPRQVSDIAIDGEKTLALWTLRIPGSAGCTEFSITGNVVLAVDSALPLPLIASS